MEFPDPVIRIAIEPKTAADQDKLSDALSRLALEDPSFKVLWIETDRRNLLLAWVSFTSKLLSTVSFVSSRWGANVGKPQVAYRETVCETAGVRVRSSGQGTGKNQYGVQPAS